jgi:purine-binding chemotaxis protein CheW
MATFTRPGFRQKGSGVQASAGETRKQFLAFDLGGEAFAIEIACVKEVIQYGEVREVPLVPAFIRGVISLRGAMVPVIDVSVRFGRPPTAIAHRSCIVILDLPWGEGSRVVGIIVENVSEVLELAPSEIEPAPSFGGDSRSGFLSGVGKVDTRFVILLDARRLLTLDELDALSGAVGGDARP